MLTSLVLTEFDALSTRTPESRGQQKRGKREAGLQRSPQDHQNSVSNKTKNKRTSLENLVQRKQISGDVRDSSIASGVVKENQQEKEQLLELVCSSPKHRLYEPMPVPIVEEPSPSESESLAPKANGTTKTACPSD